MAILSVEYENQVESCLTDDMTMRCSTSSEPGPGVHDNHDEHDTADGTDFCNLLALLKFILV